MKKHSTLPVLLISLSACSGQAQLGQAGGQEAVQLLTQLLTTPVGVCGTVLAQNAAVEANIVKVLTQPSQPLIPIPTPTPMPQAQRPRPKPLVSHTVSPPVALHPSFSLCVGPDGKSIMACVPGPQPIIPPPADVQH